MRLYAVILCLAIHASIQTSAQTPADSCGMVASTDSAATYVVDDTLATDSITTPSPQKKTPFFKKVGNAFVRLFEWFSDVDTTYIEPQKYNYAAMIQNTNTYERYRITSSQGNDFTFAPEPKIKFGPYFGWRWLFLGYTVDFNELGKKSRSTEFDLSLYTGMFGIDLFYRKTGSNYKISYASFDSNNSINTRPLKNIDFDGINVGIKGFNLYYIFNHRRFSYPAAFSQSTIHHRCQPFGRGRGGTIHGQQPEDEGDKIHRPFRVVRIRLQLGVRSQLVGGGFIVDGVRLQERYWQ